MSPVECARRTQAVAIGVLMLLASLVVYNAGCAGGGGNKRHAVLATELVALDAAWAEYVKWDKGYQQGIVEKALKEGVTKDEVTKRVAVYRVTVQQAVYCAFVIVTDVIAKTSTNDKAPLDPALSQSGELVKNVHELKPGQDPPAGFPLHGLRPSPKCGEN